MLLIHLFKSDTAASSRHIVLREISIIPGRPASYVIVYGHFSPLSLELCG